MRKLALVVTAGLVVGAFGSVASAQRQDSPKVTGGGQIDVATDGQRAGNTIAFVGIEALQTGQVQYVGTGSAGEGTAPDRWHGIVTCVDITGQEAIISGRRVGGATAFFWMEIIDNGTPAQGTDMIRLQDRSSDPECAHDQNQATTSHELGRGNATVHNGE